MNPSLYYRRDNGPPREIQPLYRQLSAENQALYGDRVTGEDREGHKQMAAVVWYMMEETGAAASRVHRGHSGVPCRPRHRASLQC